MGLFKKHIKAVIVDDDERLLKAYSSKLEHEGVNASLVDDSVNAISVIQSKKPDVVVLDVLMSGMNGWEILRQIKNDPLIKDIPVLMVSNVGSENKEQEAIEAGAAGYVVKSDVELDGLVKMIKDTAR